MTPAPPLSAFLRLDYSAQGHPVTQLVSQRAGALLAFVASRTPLSPNQLTILAFLASVAGAAVFAFGAGGGAAIAWTVLLTQLGYALDCADGQLARATGRTSPLGRWLDAFLDAGTICALAFAAVYRVVTLQPDLAGAAFLCGFAYGFARVGNLLTCTLARGGGGPAGGARSLARRAFLVLIDTPVVLLGVALLRDRPAALLAWLALGAVLFTVHSGYVARARLMRDTPA